MIRRREIIRNSVLQSVRFGQTDEIIRIAAQIRTLPAQNQRAAETQAVKEKEAVLKEHGFIPGDQTGAQLGLDFGGVDVVDHPVPDDVLEAGRDDGVALGLGLQVGERDVGFDGIDGGLD